MFNIQLYIQSMDDMWLTYIQFFNEHALEDLYYLKIMDISIFFRSYHIFYYTLVWHLPIYETLLKALKTKFVRKIFVHALSQLSITISILKGKHHLCQSLKIVCWNQIFLISYWKVLKDLNYWAKYLYMLSVSYL